MIVEKTEVVHLIVGDCGEWEDRVEWYVDVEGHVLIFRKEEEAKKYQAELQTLADAFNLGDDSVLNELDHLDSAYADHGDIYYTVVRNVFRYVESV